MSGMASQITSLAIVGWNFIQAQIKGNMKAPRHWPLCGDSPVTGESPAQRASDAELSCFHLMTSSWNVCLWVRLPHHRSHHKKPQTLFSIPLLTYTSIKVSSMLFKWRSQRLPVKTCFTVIMTIYVRKGPKCHPKQTDLTLLNPWVYEPDGRNPSCNNPPY